jgi:hypothetical protein
MRQEILRNIPIAPVAAICLLNIAETMSLIPELKGKELEYASASPTRLSVFLLSCCRCLVNQQCGGDIFDSHPE